MGEVQHFEIPADNLDRAKNFYSKLFGWNIVEASMGDTKYLMLHTGPTDKDGMVKEKGFINGGMMQRIPAVKSPVIVITVGDVDKTAADIEKMGGKIVMKKQKVGDMGYYIRFRDPEGNILGVWQNIKKP